LEKSIEMIQFPKKIDRELITDEEGKWLAAKRDLEEAIKSLPGIKISCSCDIGPNKPYMLFLRATNKKGIGFLTRCVDQRYWMHGDKWKLELIISDTLYKGSAIVYFLHSGNVVGKEAYDQVSDLLDNMEYHLNHENFMKFFKLKIEDFNI